MSLHSTMVGVDRAVFVQERPFVIEIYDTGCCCLMRIYIITGKARCPSPSSPTLFSSLSSRNSYIHPSIHRRHRQTPQESSIASKPAKMEQQIHPPFLPALCPAYPGPMTFRSFVRPDRLCERPSARTAQGLFPPAACLFVGK